jgi:hypothetical protein
LLVVRGDGFLKSTLFSVCVDTGKLTRITPGMYGDWSPDGGALVVQRVECLRARTFVGQGTSSRSSSEKPANLSHAGTHVQHSNPCVGFV